MDDPTFIVDYTLEGCYRRAHAVDRRDLRRIMEKLKNSLATNIAVYKSVDDIEAEMPME